MSQLAEGREGCTCYRQEVPEHLEEKQGYFRDNTRIFQG